MRKKLLLFVICILTFNSCMPDLTKSLENFVWINEEFNIRFTGEQLRKQIENYSNSEIKDYYTSITIMEKEYSCLISFDLFFCVCLKNENDNSTIHWYGDDDYFIFGRVSFSEDVNYENSIEVMKVFIQGGQYYEYCKDNDLFVPFSIIFYGYDNK